MTTRRRVIEAGSAVVALAMGGFVFQAVDRGALVWRPTPAFAAWVVLRQA